MTRSLAILSAVAIAGLCPARACAASEQTASQPTVERALLDEESAGATVETPSSAPATTKWEFIGTPYVWAPAVKSTSTTVQGETVTSKTSFFDLLSHLKFGIMGAVEAKHARLVLTNDLFYGHLGISASGHAGPIPLSADVDLKMLFNTSLAGYRLVDKGPSYLDVLAGARVTAFKVDLQLERPLQADERLLKRTHIAPVFASRFRAPLGGRWGAYLYGDVGGFGISSALSWQLMGTVHYELSEHWQLGAGWRHFYARDAKRGFQVEEKLDGPIATFGYRFQQN